MSAANATLRSGPEGSQAKAICVFIHGRNQSPEEMQRHVLARLSAKAVAFALPRAPLGQWWDARAIDPLTPESRTQLLTAIDHLDSVLATVRVELPGRPVLLAGFSQGACLAIEYLCTGRTPPDAVAAFTGCRVGTSDDERPEAIPVGMPVYLSGGDEDPWIPVSAFTGAALSLGRRGARLRADVFPGRGHEISDAEITMLEGLLEDLVAGKQPGMGAAR
ncbi:MULTISPECIES: alpha/beta hydrolase [Agrobacterium]|jgi:phospholipase/carboxylesterase|uniref:alpha/beta hydrolase n=1 Tax=Agrobacterium TaxID=357 RepID=UPI001FAAFE1C|nr:MULTISPECIES: dienelactone hydrolase family protein [Agrobacterium]MCZ7889477.1 dienelactone hydrolase family protein [Agrobacterium salinitolerans]UNZ54016.1 dienelactone hydrolase family protein [Agrobacterium tumefaciens]